MRRSMSSEKSSGKITCEVFKMSEITRVNDPNVGPADGVELHAKCVLTKFAVNKKGLAGISSQEVADCKIMASFDIGTVSISIPGKAKMVSVRIDELMAVLMEAAAVAGAQAPGGEEEEKSE